MLLRKNKKNRGGGLRKKRGGVLILIFYVDAPSIAMCEFELLYERKWQGTWMVLRTESEASATV